jgi:hypothetical protein
MANTDFGTLTYSIQKILTEFSKVGPDGIIQKV